MTTSPAARAELQAILRLAADEAEGARRLIEVLRPRLNPLVTRVLAAVGGSQQQVDQVMVAALTTAERELNVAVQTLAACTAQLRRPVI